MKKSCFISFLIVLQLSGNAQLMDSIAKSFENKPTLYFNWGSQYSFISNQFASIQNVKIGLDFSKTFKIGLGYNWLSKKFPERKSIFPPNYNANLKMHYVTVFAEYTFFKNYYWEATIPAQIGLGFAFYQNKEKRLTSNKQFFVAYEPVMTIQYRFLNYFGVGCGIGYRLILINRKELDEHFFSPIVLIKSKLFFGDLWNDIRHKKKKTE